MLVIIKSAPDTPEGKRGIELARDMAADICLIQNAVYFAHSEKLKDFPTIAYVLDEDCRLRGVGDSQLVKSIKKLDYDGLIDRMTAGDRVIGAL
ncbi:MAG TPA: DsrH/TusB family sulfur metabolism protein [Dissulfurispiraceae bacterium]